MCSHQAKVDRVVDLTGLIIATLEASGYFVTDLRKEVRSMSLWIRQVLVDHCGRETA